MKKSTMWLLVGIGSVVMLSVMACCAVGAFAPSNNSSYNTSVASSKIDLEKLTKEFETYVSQGNQDINGFEKAVNDKTKKIYTGTGHVDVTQTKSGAVVGYVNKDTEPTFDKAKDEKLFELNVDEKKKQVVAHDRHDNYYRHRPSSSGFFTGLFIGNMMSSHRSYYPGGYYSAPSSARYRSSGYYNRSRSYRSGSRSSYSSGSRSRSSYGSGGFGSGK